MDELQPGTRERLDEVGPANCDVLSRPSKDPGLRNRLSVDNKLSAQVSRIAPRRRVFESESLGSITRAWGQPGIANLTGRGCQVRHDGGGVAPLAKFRIRKIDHKGDLSGSRFADARLLHGRLLILDGRVPAPVHAIAVAVANARTKPILGTPEANNVLVDLFGSGQFDQVDRPFAPVPERLDPERRPLLELLVDVLIVAK